MRTLLAAVAIAAAFIAAELGAGGLGYGEEAAPRPCERREGVPGHGLDPVAQRFALRAIDKLACERGQSREELVLELAEKGVDVVELERRWRDGLDELVELLQDRLLDAIDSLLEGR